MRRLLAEVRTEKFRRRYRRRNGLEYTEWRVRAAVVGSAVRSLSVPGRVVGKEITVHRDYLAPWRPRKGDLLVLDSSESARILCPRRPRLDPPAAGERVATLRRVDVDRDGYAEDILSNAFVTAALQPHRGARLLSLSGRSGTDLFARSESYTMAGQYILLGGSELVIGEAGSPGDIWKSSFRREEEESGSGAPSAPAVGYSRRLQSPDGVAVTKRASVDEALPLVLESYTLRYVGRSKPGKDGAGESAGMGTNDAGGCRNGPEDRDEEKKAQERKDEAMLTAGVRMSTALQGDEPSLNIFEIPCADGLHRVRYQRPPFGVRWRWRDWRNEHFAPRGGFLVSRCESGGPALMALFNQRKATHVSIRRDYEGPEVMIV
ncbi:MAG: hypothetical protein GF400_09180, partial [Candidatus Eisenbacteria bacterium]|nr:hypothetical protein [Candidatus Eisenbacteria bacterium]